MANGQKPTPDPNGNFQRGDCGASGPVVIDGVEKDKSVGLYPPETGFLGSWGDFIHAFVVRYKSSPVAPYDDAPIPTIEIWNEPNLVTFWGSFSVNGGKTVWNGPQPQAMADLFDEAVESLTMTQLGNLDILTPAISPEGDALNSFTRNFVTSISEVNQVDGLSVHLYKNGAPSTQKAVDGIMEFFDDQVVQARDGQQGVPPSAKIWITEIGFPSAGGGTQGIGKKANDATQRSRTRNALRLLAARKGRGKVVGFVAHRLYDCLPGESCLSVTPDFDRRGGFGLWGDPDSEDPSKAFCYLRDRAGTGARLRVNRSEVTTSQQICAS